MAIDAEQRLRDALIRITELSEALIVASDRLDHIHDLLCDGESLDGPRGAIIERAVEPTDYWRELAMDMSKRMSPAQAKRKGWL